MSKRKLEPLSEPEACSATTDEIPLQTQPIHEGGSYELNHGMFENIIEGLNTQNEDGFTTITSDSAHQQSSSLEEIKTQQESEQNHQTQLAQQAIHTQLPDTNNTTNFGKTKKRKINHSSSNKNFGKKNNLPDSSNNSFSTTLESTSNATNKNTTSGKIFGNYKNYYSYRYNDENLRGSSSSPTSTIMTTTDSKRKQCELSHIDPRLEIIAQALSTHFKQCDETTTSFELSCLDIGCNQGLFTIQMADLIDGSLSGRVDNGKSITLKSLDAIDIDAELIRHAKNHLEALKKFNTIEDTESKQDDHLGMSVQTYVAMERLEASEKEEKLFIWENNRKLLKTKGENGQNIVLCKKSYMLPLIDKIHFKTQNFVEEIAPLVSNLESLGKARENKFETLLNTSLEKTSNKRPYDIITCLSVTKWIHLNYGDDSIKFLFHKVFRLLKSNGGIFVLEPQTWKSYAKKRDLTPTFQEQFKNIKFRPTAFHEYLMKQVGFSRCETIFIEKSEKENTTSEKSKKKGFKKRPICFYFK
ncbi:hypothetical protein C9374_013871 [Naegleria lovaniensis]|uniref:RNA methyltransferase n=1 Tax=Naegleria lovaniensis TaxID=51637 RepID=A0AA88GVQ3_NAELO|nr:uncharacterized protein C9374_013871 [Naegleria lovaniensis]KAG2389311.1 hypothetical protein C9374_013871 [Naegleria lovaniensis]